MQALPSPQGPRSAPFQASRSGWIAASAPARWAGRIGRAFVWAGFTLGIGFSAGFLWFAWSIPNHEVALNTQADGIVVLTGGASRITDAFELLAEGRGKRLLISGVHHGTSMREIARAVPQYQDLLACCVDLDHFAVNTVGNATGARQWAKSLNLQSLIVVTSNYHMPRSMAELGRQLPDVKLIAFPVVTEKLRAEPWWSSLPTARLLATEYLKYVVAQVRMRFDPAPEASGLARARTGARG